MFWVQKERKLGMNNWAYVVRWSHACLISVKTGQKDPATELDYRFKCELPNPCPVTGILCLMFCFCLKELSFLFLEIRLHYLAKADFELKTLHLPLECRYHRYAQLCKAPER